MCETSEVVVVFPFDPVIATSLPRRKRHASSISLHTGMPRVRACSQRRQFCRHARADDNQILIEQRWRDVRAELELHAGRAQLRGGSTSSLRVSRRRP